MSNRIFLGVELLYPAEVRRWDRASELAWEYGISRSKLYHIKDRGREALEEVLKPKPVGRLTEEKLLRVDRKKLSGIIGITSSSSVFVCKKEQK